MTDPRAESVLDRDVIDGLKALDADGAPGLLEELVSLYLSDTPPRLKDLVVALDGGDARGVEEIAHSLKSSSGNLGAAGLASLMRQIEALGRAHDLHGARPLVARTDGEFRRVEEALRAELA